MIILGSASPRRKMLLESAGLDVVVESADIDESHESGEEPLSYVVRMARGKARVISDRHKGEDHVVISADTIVVHGGKILGKPRTREEAREMLRSLSGQIHSVYTGVCLCETRTGEERHFVSETKVEFMPISEEQIDWYIQTGEPMDKAGAYGIQGKAAVFVTRIEGSYTNVVGLPLCETVQVLSELGYKMVSVLTL